MIHAALDTSLAAAFAIAADDHVLGYGSLAVRGRSSDEQLVPWLLDTLRELELGPGDIQRWTVGTGPGSFSGIRVGISWVLGVCAGTGATARGVPSSLPLALAAGELAIGDRVAVLHDARRDQVILSAYQRTEGGLVAVDSPAVVSPADVVASDYAAVVTAQDTVIELVGNTFGERLIHTDSIDPRQLLTADWPWPANHPETIASLEPVYVRPAVFVKPRPVTR